MKTKRTANTRRSDFKSKKRFCTKNALSVGLLIFIFLTAFTGLVSGEEKLENQSIRESISAAEIGASLLEVSNLMKDIRNKVAPSQEFKNIQKDISDVSARFETEQQATMKLLQAEATLESLQTDGVLWQENKKEMDKLLRVISDREDKLQAAMNQLADLQKTWSQTLERMKSEPVEKSIVQNINEVILSIENEQKYFKNEQTAVTDLQRQVAGMSAQCLTILDEIFQVQRTTFSKMGKESQPIWSHELLVRASSGGFAHLREIAAIPKKDMELYFFDPSGLMLIHFGFFIFLSALFFMMRSRISRWAPDDSSVFMSSAFNHPYSVSFIATLLIASSPYFSLTQTIQNLFQVLALVVMIRLIQPAVHQRMRFALYALGLLFALDMVRNAFAGAIFIDQVMIITEAFIGIGVLGWIWISGKLQPSFIEGFELTRLRILRTGVVTVLVLLTVGLMAGILGFLLAAHLFVSGVIISGAIALALFASVKIVGIIVAFSLRVWPLRLLYMVSHNRSFLEHRIYRILVWAAIPAWVVRVLDYVGLLQPFILLGENLLAAKLERGSVSISLGDVFAFILAVLTAHYLSRFICFVLNEDVFPRTKVSHGIRYTTTRLISYVIMFFGFYVGVGLVGIDLTKVTVLIGAFSVGIGFGLQSVVNNFVSGLILLFERPIQMGDTIEVGNIRGTVRRIGIRASIVRSRQGAEIIIPNSQLVAEQVTNWTLSDQRRRIDLPIGVNYASEPRKVIEVIETVASAHPRVLKNPAPQVLLTGFGDNSISYELWSWTNESDDYPKIRSELAVAIYDAIDAAGMSFPFPQREVRLIQNKEA